MKEQVPTDYELEGKYIISAIVFFAVIGMGAYFYYSNPQLIYSLKNPPPTETLRGASGVVQIVEYSDFKCFYCFMAQPTVKQLKEIYGGKINITHKHRPFHPGADKAAEASECAKDRGRFQEYYEALFNAEFNEGKDVGKPEVLKNLAAETGLSEKEFSACLDGGVKKELIQEQIREAQSRGVSGTPTFFINGRKIVGAQSIETFRGVIDEALKEK